MGAGARGICWLDQPGKNHNPAEKKSPGAASKRMVVAAAGFFLWTKSTMRLPADFTSIADSSLGLSQVQDAVYLAGGHCFPNLVEIPSKFSRSQIACMVMP